jgi:hypothetical protein
VGIIRDDAMYVVLAKSLASGHGYSWLHLPGAPAATHFPPGYPAVLALLWWISPAFPVNLIVFKLANALFGAAAAVGVAALVRARFGMSPVGSGAFAIAALVGAPTLALGALVMSEPLFLALLIATLILAERAADAPARRRDLIVIGLLAGATTLVRTHGIALVAAIVLLFCLRRRFKEAAIVLAASLVMLLPWQLWVSAHSGILPASMRGNYESYGAWLMDGLRAQGVGLVGRTALRTTNELATMFGALVAPYLPAAGRFAALGALAAIATIGVRSLWRRAPIAGLFLAIHAVIVVCWPFTPARFVWSVWPLVLLLPVLGARELLAWRPSAPRLRAFRVAALAAVAWLACGYALYNVRGYHDRAWATVPQNFAQRVTPLLGWVAAHTSRDAVLATESEGPVYLYTGRHAVPVGTFAVTDYLRPRTPAENAQVVRGILARYRPAAVIVSSGWMRAGVRELALAHPPELAVVDTFAGGGLVLAPTSR